MTLLCIERGYGQFLSRVIIIGKVRTFDNITMTRLTTLLLHSGGTR